MRGLRRTSVVAGLAALALGLSACGGGDDEGGGAEGTAQQGGTFSVGISEPQFLTPANTNETSGSQVLAALYTGLVEFEEGTNAPILSELAESIESENDDNQNWTVTIKDGWTFHDGTPVTSDSFINAWNFAATGANGQSNNTFFKGIEGYCAINNGDGGAVVDGAGQPCPDSTPTGTTLSGLAKVSDTEFTVTLIAPNNTFFAQLGYTAFLPMPEAFTTATPEQQTAFQEAPVGNGPYMMDGTWVHNQEINVQKFADYGGTAGNADGITFRIYENLDTQYADTQADTLDINDTLPPSALASYQTDFEGRYEDVETSNYTFVGFTTDAAYSVEIRKAISMAIDREQITDVIFNGTRMPATDFVAPVVNGWEDGGCGEACEFDAAAAKSAFDAAGGLPGNAMTITYNEDGGHKDWVDAVCNQLQVNLGVTCTGVPKARFAVLLDDLDAAQAGGATFGPFRLGWIMDYPSMENFLGPLYGTGGSSNYYGYSNPQFDALVGEGRTKATEEEAIEVWRQAADILAEEFPVIPMWFAVQPSVWSNNVENVKFDAFNKIRLSEVVVTNA